MVRRPRKQGFTVWEIMLTLTLIGIAILMSTPKMIYSQEDKRTKATIRESFGVVGELYLSRLKDKTLAAPDIGGATGENKVFAQYLYQHLNYISAEDPTSVVDAADYCTIAADYFVLPQNVKIRKICDIASDATLPFDRMEILVEVPTSKNPATTDFTVVIPENAERYTTMYGAEASPVAADCRLADEVLEIVATCP